MTAGAFIGAWAEAIEAARTRATGTAAKIPSGLTFTGSSPARNASQRSVKSVHCEADLAAKRDHGYPYQQRDGCRRPGGDRRLPARAPALDIADTEKVEHHHVEAGQSEQHELTPEEEIVGVMDGVR